MNTKWGYFYKNKINDNYLKSLSNRYNPFISYILEEIKKDDIILETGLGMGNITKLLIRKNNQANYIGIDNNMDMLKISEINLLQEKKILLQKYDIRKKYINRVDLIHSHGVLEHLNINDIKKTIDNQLKVCNTLIHYVPTNGYNYKSYGDELLISSKEWVSICKPTNILTFNNDKDLILIWKK